MRTVRLRRSLPERSASGSEILFFENSSEDLVFLYIRIFPVAGIIAVFTVITHNEIFAFRHIIFFRIERIGIAVCFVRIDGFAVYEESVRKEGKMISGQSDDTFAVETF